MDCRSPSIIRLPLAQPSLLLPTGGLYLALNNPHKQGSRWTQPESRFEQALHIYWKTNRTPRADVSFGVDALVLPYLAHFCAIAKMFPQSASCDLLSQINPTVNTNDVTRNTLMLHICAELLERIEDDRNAADNPTIRLTTNLEVKNYLVESIRNMSETFAKERMLLQVEGPLEDWRKESMGIYAQAAAIDDFAGKCQMAFNRYRPGAVGSLMDADFTDDLEFVRAIESAPGLRLNPANTINFRCEMAMASNLYADTHLCGDKTSIPYTAYTPMQYAVESHVLSQSTKPCLSGRFPEDRMKVALWKQNLIDGFGFDYFSAEQLLKQVHRFS